MILSGWILPDYTEVKCISYSDNKEHIKIVKDYLNTLAIKAPDIYNKIYREIKKNRRSDYSLDDIAVNILGWIKINDKPFKTVYYLHIDDYSHVVYRYMKLDYSCIAIPKKHYIYIKNSSLYLDK